MRVLSYGRVNLESSFGDLCLTGSNARTTENPMDIIIKMSILFCFEMGDEGRLSYRQDTRCLDVGHR